MRRRSILSAGLCQLPLERQLIENVGVEAEPFVLPGPTEVLPNQLDDDIPLAACGTMGPSTQKLSVLLHEAGMPPLETARRPNRNAYSDHARKGEPESDANEPSFPKTP